MPEVGEVEIVFTGLCSFLNLRNLNGTMPDPSVILPRTPQDVPHVPFIAFDKREVAVQTDGPPFETVKFTNDDFLFRAFNGQELIIREDVPGWPNILASYDLIAKKDIYWPEARNRWNRDFVPAENDKPKSAKVAAFMYFGGGTISAERMTDFPWKFRAEEGTPPVRGYYAQELVYRIYPYRPPGPATIQDIPAFDTLTITIRSLDDPAQQETCTFTCKRPDVHKIKLWIGNNDKDDIHRALLRLSSRPRRAVHFKYLNDVSDIDGIGPVPTPLVPRVMFPVQGPDDGTGSDTGYCGPHNAGE